MARTPWVDADGDPVPPSDIHVLDPLVLAASLVKQILMAGFNTASTVEYLLKAQVNTAWSREAFHEAAAQEIESLVSGAVVFIDDEEDDDA